MDKLQQLLSLQEDRYQKIDKGLQNYRKSPKIRITLSYLDSRLENLESVWQSFKSSHEQIVAFVPKENRTEMMYFQNDIFDEGEEIYLTYKGELKANIQELTPRKQPEKEKQKPNAEIKLPRIEIPTFSGKYVDWPSYHDLFKALIHVNETLDDVQKLHYLKSSLSGEAETLLKNIPITSNNYKVAWETLQERYNNKRYISNCLFKRLFSIRNVTTESSLHIKQLRDITVECLSSLKNLGCKTDTWDPIIIYMTLMKLDAESQKLWEQQNAALPSNEFPTYDCMKQFLETRFRSIEMLEQTTKTVKPKSFHAAVGNASSTECAFCKEDDHYIYQCKQFIKQTYKDRYDYVQKNNLCFNCLTPYHSAIRCLRDTTCRICQKKHHSLLHPDKKEAVKEKSQKDSQENIVSHFINQSGQILLATALVDVTSSHGYSHAYRALIDQGSQASFVTEDLVQTLGLKRIKINGVVSGLSGGNSLHTKFMVEVQLKSRCKTNFTIPVKAYVLKNITSYLPTQQITVSNWPQLEGLELADPNFNKPNKIHLLLGAEVYSEIIDTGLLKSSTGIIAQQTHLGWILSGDTSKTNPEKKKQIISMHSCVCVGEVLRKFWEIDNEILTTERKYTKEEERAEKIYKETITRDQSGRYRVNLPFKENITVPEEHCGKTKENAIIRFTHLETKFKQDPKLKDEYSKVINEYLELGHMQSTVENTKKGIYLPHHAVIRNDKDTTKVRVVFDASAKGSKGYSLNDTLLVGPAIQKDLRTLIMQWRQHKIAIVSDIVKMYRQVLVADEHTDYQKIIWRDDANEEYKSYKLLTVTFGTASAPFLAVRTLTQVANDEGHKFPVAAEIVKESFYMDDLLTGASNIEQAMDIYNQVSGLLQTAGFELQKWSSNSDEFLQAIKHKKDDLNQFEIKFDKIIKTLGLYWDRVDDKFKFSITLPTDTNQITKRSVLAEVARLFDPFGWLAPSIVKAKIFIQKLWLCTSGWDEQLPMNLLEEWLSFRAQLPDLQNIEINRWIHTYPTVNRIELHGFADASTSAYAAVLYLKVVENDEVNVSILESKTKVAPLKQISVARLELCAAVLLAKLLAETANNLKIDKKDIYAYTDSMVVLAWIEGQPLKWQTFVANRVTEIQNRLENDRWFHIPSEENPADLASRGVDPSELKNKDIWWKGPKWLNEIQGKPKTKKPVPETNLEMRKQNLKTFHLEDKETPIWSRFSNFNKMVRVLTYCRRFLHLKTKKDKTEEQTNYLTHKEMKETIDVIIRQEQGQKYEEEINDLKEKGKVKRRSKLGTLSPYLDNNGLLRVGGRIQAAKLAQERRHPVIIPKDSHIATLLVRDAHLKLLHGGMALMINYLRSRYWIIGLKPLVKKCYRKCPTCIRHKANVVQPQMGELPRVRVNPGRPFETSGVDFAGPIQMRVSKGRGQRSFKGYICLFVCMKTRAIHLEAVSDLTTQGFIAAFRRFTSRRGHCSDVWSDNGLNFVGAAKELSLMLSQSMDGVLKQIAELLHNDGTVWHFIPPKSPNFGGLWEAGIKAVKTHLKKTIGDSTLTYEEMATLLSQIEACLNSRPIGYLNDHPDDIMPLTPAHFLVGGPLITIPEKHDANEAISPLHRWRIVQKMMKHFWDRWSKEVLHTMQQRHKWQTKSERPQIGDVVIIKDTDLPPTKWLLAKILDIHQGPDNEVRVVTLKCKDSVLKRPLSKLIFLPREL